MQDKKIHKLIIIGSGPAGLTAGIYASRANLSPLIIEGSNPGGQLMNTTYVENWPGEKKILGPDLIFKMKEHAQLFGSEFVPGSITKVDFSSRPFSAWIQEKQLQAHSIIISTGASPKKLNIPGESEYWGKGVTVCAVCDGAFYKDMPVLIIGGGDTAMEDASFMTRFTNQITVVQIQDKLSASHIMQQRILNNPNINIIYNSTVTQINGDGNRVTEAVIKNVKTDEQQTLKTNGIFLAIGSNPNTGIFKDQLELDSYGYIKVTKHTNTSVEGIFAAGDVVDPRYKQAIVSSGHGCSAALDAERYLANL
jgi:thioredoxin reductase (NADPH)